LFVKVIKSFFRFLLPFFKFFLIIRHLFLPLPSIFLKNTFSQNVLFALMQNGFLSLYDCTNGRGGQIFDLSALTGVFRRAASFDAFSQLKRKIERKGLFIGR
jgi:hypothetical protein